MNAMLYPAGFLADPSEDGIGIRPLQHRDLPMLSRLFGEIFRGGRHVSGSAVEASLAQTYLSSPQDAIQPSSLVDIGSDGRVEGFMGVVTMGARFGDRRLRVGVLGAFMASEAHRAKTAMRLLRATKAQPLDLIFSDTANRTSLDISRAIKFTTLPLRSLEWVKIIRPCGTATALLRRGAPTIGRLLTPVARLMDIQGRHLPFASTAQPDRPLYRVRSIAPEDFVTRAPSFVSRFALRPEWGRDELSWLLGKATERTKNGPLHLREVMGPDGRCLGLFLLYAQPGLVAYALQVLASPRGEETVVSAMIGEAAELGAVAVRGAVAPDLMEGLIRQKGIAYHHVAASIFFTRDRQLQEVMQSGSAYFGGLLGETWTRLVTDDFG